MKKNKIAIYMCLVLLNLIGGCAPTIVATGFIGAANIVNDKRDVSTQINDLKLSLRLDRQINKNVANSHIRVGIFNYKCLLIGEVSGIDEKQKVLAIVKEYSEIKEVLDQIVVGTNATAKEKINDRYLESKVKTNLLLTKDIMVSSISIYVEKNKLYLLGLVTKKEAKKIKEICAEIKGIKEITTFFEIVEI